MLSANRDPQLIDAIESVLAQKTVTLSNASTFFEELNNGVLKELNETDDNDVSYIYINIMVSMKIFHLEAVVS